jgi:protein involved in polysaccharide export with SLBB domain
MRAGISPAGRFIVHFSEPDRMTVFRSDRAAATRWRILLLSSFAVILTACATRRPELLTPPAPIAALPMWKLEVGDQIKTRIYREPDLAGDATVGANGTAYFPGIGRVAVQGMSLDELQADLAVRYSKMIVDAAVDASFSREVVVYGQVRIPGVYLVDPGTTVLGLIAKAGGASGPGKSPILTLVKADGRQLSLTREARLALVDISHGDAIFVQDDTFFGRNASNLSSLVLVATALLALISITSILGR